MSTRLGTSPPVSVPIVGSTDGFDGSLFTLSRAADGLRQDGTKATIPNTKSRRIVQAGNSPRIKCGARCPKPLILSMMDLSSYSSRIPEILVDLSRGLEPVRNSSQAEACGSVGDDGRMTYETRY